MERHWPVVICFHFIIFVLLGTAGIVIYPADKCCDLLSFHYLCAIRNSKSHAVIQDNHVVICFHFIIFVLLGTAGHFPQTDRYGCDLLSFHYLCAIRNSGAAIASNNGKVVICFHFIIFVLLGTATSPAHAPTPCCDLLSFHYLCAIRNSCNLLPS